MVFRSPRIGAGLFLCFAFRFRVFVFALRFHAFCHVLFLRHVPRFIFALRFTFCFRVRIWFCFYFLFWFWFCFCFYFCFLVLALALALGSWHLALGTWHLKIIPTVAAATTGLCHRSVTRGKWAVWPITRSACYSRGG